MKGILKRKDRAPNGHSNGTRKNTVDPGFIKNRCKRQKVALDALSWQSVQAVDTLDDFEGFYGLEEVDDVEVVRDGGLLTFRARQESANGASKLLDPSSEDDWQGFSDKGSLPGSPPQVLDPVPQKKRQKVARHEQHSKDEVLDGTSFHTLDPEPAKRVAKMTKWLSLGLSTQLLESLSDLKFLKPTPIQSSTIPDIIKGHDVVGKAQTGSGKTLAYGIPIAEHFIRSADVLDEEKKLANPALALILAPTRELAHQIAAHLTSLYAPFNGPRVMTITGGLSVHKQQRQIQSADIIVATPGRLWEVMEGSRAVLDRIAGVHFLVVDEADRILSEGHFQEVSQILQALEQEKEPETPEGDQAMANPKTRQTLVFSATFDKGLQEKLGQQKRVGSHATAQQESMAYLVRKLKFRDEKPKFIDVDAAAKIAQGIREGLVECGGLEKDLYLYAMIMLHPRTRTLIFTNSISAVKRLTPLLQNLNLPAYPLHSTMPQKARLRNIERFTSAESAVLIATDVAARGLDIPGVQLVIHYHLPRTADAYVHRSGRTARGDARGVSILLCAPEEVNGLRRLVARVHGSSASDKSAGLATIPVDRKVIARLKPRIVLAKKLADVNVSKDKGRKEDAFLREAAEELGVDYDSEELDKMGGGRRGRGNQRKEKERKHREVGKEEMKAWRAELASLLSSRVNVGVSERYIAQGVVNIDDLLKSREGDFLGSTPLLKLEDL